MTLRELIVQSHELAVAKGWYQDGPRNVGELLMLVTTELAEAMEEYRNGRMETYVGEGGKPEGFGVEIGDAIIRLADMAGHLGIDLERAIELKHEFNKTRPARHGGKRA